MTNAPTLIAALQRQISDTSESLRQEVVKAGNSRLRDGWPDWRDRLGRPR